MIYIASDKCIGKLMNLESFRDMPYRDGGGLFTIGYGRRCDEHAPQTNRIAEAAWLKAHVDGICAWLDAHLPGLFQHQVDALCLFIYNIGLGAFETSDTYKLLKAHDAAAFLHWLQWIKDQKGQVEAGLVTRRHFEVNLFIFGWS